jgi:hypothetical protein
MSAFAGIYCFVAQHGGKTTKGFFDGKSMGKKMGL